LAWTAPKTNWTSSDVISSTDLNRIEGNINHIEHGTRTPNQAAVPAASGPLRAILDFFAALIKSITGKPNWFDAPDTTLAAVNQHMTNTANPHNVTAAQIGALSSIDGVSGTGGNVDLVAGANISITPDNTHKRITIGGTGTWPNADTVDGLHASAFTRARNGGQNIWVQNTAPTALAVGDIWIDTTS